MDVQKRRKQLIAGLVISLTGFAISVNTLPSLVSGLSLRYGVSPDAFGIAFFLQYITYTLCSVISGYIAGRGFSKLEWLIALPLFVTSGSLFFIGAVPTFPAFVLLMALIGGSGGLIESNGTTLLTQHDTSPNGKFIHTSQLFYCIGAVLAPMAIGILLAREISEQMIGIWIGLITLLIAGLVGFLLKPFSRKIPVLAGHAPADSAEKTAENNNHVPAFSILIWFILVMFLYVKIEISFASWLPVYLVNTFPVTEASASFHLTLFWGGLAATRLLYIFLTKGSIEIQLALHITGMIASLLLIHFFAYIPAMRIFAILLLGLSCGPVWPLIVNLYSKRYTQKHYIMYMVSAGSMGALAGPFVTSLLFRPFSIPSMMLILLGYGVFFVISFTLLLILPKKLERR